MEEITREILELVKKKMAEQGAYDRDAYKQFTEETIDYYLEKGKLIDDDNLEFIKDRLMDIYDDVKDQFSGSGD
ncbi:MAG: hypothetical protein MUC28_03210 [Planctomycetes bacterium]|jgi:hypothetical protein|nr:hypothetical protein [Planctomycetota bacterium]